MDYFAFDAVSTLSVTEAPKNAQGILYPAATRACATPQQSLTNSKVVNAHAQ